MDYGNFTAGMTKTIGQLQVPNRFCMCECRPGTWSALASSVKTTVPIAIFAKNGTPLQNSRNISANTLNIA